METSIRVGGRKPAAETLRERLAFNDPDRSTPLHDDICLWLDEWLHDEDHLWTLCHGGRREWTPQRIERLLREEEACRTRQLASPYTQDRDRAEWDRRVLGPPPPFEGPELLGTCWEKAIGDEKWVSGFIDLNAEIEQTGNIALGEHFAHSNYGVCRPSEWHISRHERQYAFEVKSSIPSLGELLRQIRYYERKHTATYYVVAPDDRYAGKLNEQGVGFIHYPSGSVSRP